MVCKILSVFLKIDICMYSVPKLVIGFRIAYAQTLKLEQYTVCMYFNLTVFNIYTMINTAICSFKILELHIHNSNMCIMQFCIF